MSDAKKVVSFPDLRAIEAEASAWIARLDSGTLSDEELAAYREWCSRSPHHKEALARLAAVWDNLDILKDLASPAPHPAPSIPKVTGPFVNLPPWPAAFAATLALLITIGALFGLMRSDEPARPHVYSTAVGEQKNITLADGSSILLNTDSLVEVRYNRSARNVRLLQGEAFFDVTRQPDRPFTVYAGTGRVRALGTAFTVQLHDHTVEVTVTEGNVELASLVDPRTDAHADDTSLRPQPLAQVSAGQNAFFSQKIERLETIPMAEINRKLSWRQGLLIFSGDPLAKVVADISRYTNITIVIQDPELRDLRIGGYFKVGEVEAMFEALEESFNVHVEKIGDKQVNLSKAL